MTIYVETSVVIYITARLSRDLLIAARQEVTREWWEYAQANAALFASDLVVEEARDGDPVASEQRLELIRTMSLLEVTAAAGELASKLIAARAVPEQAPRDAIHIAVASLHGMQYLATWNFKHIANVTRRRDIVRVLEDAGHKAPIIATPEDLMEAIEP